MADGRIPRVVLDATALKTLKISAADGFVLSRINGSVTEHELASLTGLPEAQIKASLEKLSSVGAVDFAPDPRARAAEAARPNILGAGTATTSIRPASVPPPPPGLPPMRETRESRPGDSVKPPPRDSKPPAVGGVTSTLLADAIARIPDGAPELTEEVDLPVELRRRILGIHSVVASLDHYALLGIPREADKKAVKRAYFELAALFHPDRYFRKNLGTFKSKMEIVFAKVSSAYETLVDKTQRAEYDAYLGDVLQSQGVEAMLREVMAEVAAAERDAVAEAERPGSVPPAPGATVSRPSSPPPAPAGATGPNAPPAKTPISDQLRREALAMRLRGGVRPAPKPAATTSPKSPSSPAPAAAMTSPQAVDALRRRYEERVEQGRVHQGLKYVGMAEQAESRNDLTAAAAAYRVAMPFLQPNDAVYVHAQEVIQRSEQALSDTYIRQAEHEEKQKLWERADSSWGRVARLRPDDARVQERYANAIVHNSGDLHKASQYAQRAVTLAPDVPEYRCTLASVFQAAGLGRNARRELDLALEKFPDHAGLKALLAKIPKQ